MRFNLNKGKFPIFSVETNWVQTYYGAHESQMKLHRIKQGTMTDIYSYPADLTSVQIKLVPEITKTIFLFIVKADNQNLSATSYFALGKKFYLSRFRNIHLHRQFHFDVLT